MYISFFQNLVHTFLVSIVFFQYFFGFFHSRLWSHIFLQKYDEIFPQWSILERIVPDWKRKLLFIQNIRYESGHKWVFWEQTLLKAPRIIVLPVTVDNYHQKRYHKTFFPSHFKINIRNQRAYTFDNNNGKGPSL